MNPGSEENEDDEDDAVDDDDDVVMDSDDDDDETSLTYKFTAKMIEIYEARKRLAQFLGATLSE